MRRVPPSALLAILALVVTAACAAPAPRASIARPADRAADSAELLRLHERQRTAHLERRADWLVEEQVDGMLSVSGGRVSVGRRDRTRASFQQYLDAVTFQSWDDVVPPRIRISPDGQMAYVIVEKRVHLTPRAPGAAAAAERVRYAWMSVYEKQDGRWRLAAIASTDRPDSL